MNYLARNGWNAEYSLCNPRVSGVGGILVTTLYPGSGINQTIFCDATHTGASPRDRIIHSKYAE
jgi:hypothetical protein